MGRLELDASLKSGTVDKVIISNINIVNNTSY